MGALKWIGKIVLVMVTLLSGSLGVIQQVIILNSANPNPIWQEKVFSFAIWIAFIISAAWLWILEHRKVIGALHTIAELEQQIAGTEANIVGDFQRCKFEPMLEEKNAPQGPFPGIPDYKEIGTYVCVLLTLTNTGEAAGILKFAMEIRFEGEGPSYADGAIYWPQLGNPMDVFGVSDAGFDLKQTFKEHGVQLKKRTPIEGYLVFEFPGVFPDQVEGDEIKMFPTLYVHDAGLKIHQVKSFGGFSFR